MIESKLLRKKLMNFKGFQTKELIEPTSLNITAIEPQKNSNF